MNATFRDALANLPDALVRYDEPMAAHTTYRIGGPADAWVEVHTEAALAAVLATAAAAQAELLVLGGGSNVLCADAGVRGVVLRLAGGFDSLGLTRDAFGPGAHRIEAGAAVSVTRLLRLAKDGLLAGVEMLGGVPGTVGGAVYMNAGTAAGELADSLEAARVLTPTEPTRWIPAAELALSYRHAELPPGGVVTAARFRVRDADPSMRERLDEILAHRKRTQPLQVPSCGSVFTNPPGDHAGRLVEAAGLKGTREGGAQVSERHANWIINAGGASARDVRALIMRCQGEVQRRFGVLLHPEVQLIGAWQTPPAPSAPTEQDAAPAPSTPTEQDAAPAPSAPTEAQV